MAEIPLDLSELSREDLEKIFSAATLPTGVKEEAAMLYELSDPEGPYVPVEEVDLSKEWTINTSPHVHIQILEVLKTQDN